MDLNLDKNVVQAVRAYIEFSLSVGRSKHTLSFDNLHSASRTTTLGMMEEQLDSFQNHHNLAFDSVQADYDLPHQHSMVHN